MARKHWVRGALQGDVARNGRFPDLFVAAFLAQSLELGVEIKYQRRLLEPAGEPRSIRVQSDHEEPLAANAQTEVRRVRV